LEPGPQKRGRNPLKEHLQRVRGKLRRKGQQVNEKKVKAKGGFKEHAQAKRLRQSQERAKAENQHPGGDPNQGKPTQKKGANPLQCQSECGKKEKTKEEGNCEGCTKTAGQKESWE